METFYTSERSEWRAYLAEHFESLPEIWFIFPMKESGEKSLSYNDAVEEALCFGWIDSIVKHTDELHRAQRFTPRRKGSPYSRPNIERLIWLDAHGLIHPKVRDKVLPVLQAPFVFPPDIIEVLRQDEAVWENYLQFSDPYKRIRVAYIEAARKRPEEFRKRLNSFVEKTRRNKLIMGYGGIEKYYAGESPAASEEQHAAAGTGIKNTEAGSMNEKPVVADVTQKFYDSMASQYDKFYLDWQAATHEEARFLSGIFQEYGFDRTARILDCACGIGTQAIGLAALGYSVTASDISAGEIEEAKRRAEENHVSLTLKQADFCALSDAFTEQFDIVIAMDNALPHMLSHAALEKAVNSIAGRVRSGGIFVASIRDYDLMLQEKPAHSAPYVHKTEKGQRVLFQTWDWAGENYSFIQYIIDDEEALQISKFECEYRATRRDELTGLLRAAGCGKVTWKFPEETGFYQPIVIAEK